MTKHVSLHWILLTALLCGALGYSGVSFARQVDVPHGKALRITRENHRIKNALNEMGNKDSGEATLTYYRQGQILSFEVTDYDARGRFKGANLSRQVHYFENHTGIFSLSPQVQITKSARHHHKIQLNEQHKQQIENHIEAEQAIARAKAQAKAQAKARAKKKAQKARAQQKAKQQQARKQKKQAAEKQQAKKEAAKQKGDHHAKKQGE